MLRINPSTAGPMLTWRGMTSRISWTRMPRVVASERKEATVACEEVTSAILVTPSSDPMWARDLACPASSGAVVRMLGCVGRPPDNVE